MQKFVPGQRLVEVDLAGQFGVSRNSVREALQRLVGGVQRGIDMALVILAQCGHADGHADGQRRQAGQQHEGFFIDALAQLLGHLPAAGQIRRRQHHRKLLAAEAAQQGAIGQAGAQPLRYFAQHQVTGGMAVVVIDLLEQVDVQHQGADAVAGVLQQRGQLAEKAGTAQQPGQAVMCGRMVQRLEHAFARGIHCRDQKHGHGQQGHAGAQGNDVAQLRIHGSQLQQADGHGVQRADAGDQQAQGCQALPIAQRAPQQRRQGKRQGAGAVCPDCQQRTGCQGKQRCPAPEARSGWWQQALP